MRYDRNASDLAAHSRRRWGRGCSSSRRLGSRQEFAQVIHVMENMGAKPILDQFFPLKDAAAAQRRLEEGQQFGKIVLQMDE